MNVPNPDLPVVDTETNARLAAIGAGEDPLLAANRLHVAPLAAKTPAFDQHTAAESAYFICSLKTASMHRKDGKKLPFIGGMLKTDIQEDIDYLREEVYKHRNPYIREATGGEIDIIEEHLNPKAFMRKQATVEAEKEIEARIEAEVQRRLAANTDAAKIAGIDSANANPAPDPAKGVQVIPITPVSSTDIAGASAGGESAAARAAAAIAAINAVGKNK